jgi:predicted O-methyltransferase YrrM
MIGLEFGSGRSTRWLAGKLKLLVSVEHAPVWYSEVKRSLESAQITNVDYRFIALDHPPEEPERANYDPLPRYVAVLNEFDDETFDFILIDGHYRTACVLLSLNKLKPGGLLLVDDVNMWWHRSPLPIPSSWEIVDESSNGLKTARIWMKPRMRP